MSPAETRSWAVTAAGVALAFLSCGRLTWEHAELYDNGQLRVLAGSADANGKRDGPWMFLDRDGSVLYSEVVQGDMCNRTGFYIHGLRTRPLTSEEERAQLRRIDEYIDRAGLKKR